MAVRGGFLQRKIDGNGIMVDGYPGNLGEFPLRRYLSASWSYFKAGAVPMTGSVSASPVCWTNAGAALNAGNNRNSDAPPGQ